MRLDKPIAVFDAGIGSYAIVEAIRRRLPRQDILYFADRASFPYGGKGRDELIAVMKRTIRFLETYHPSAIVIASNAPSIMALDAVRDSTATPLFGVFPPIVEAVSRSTTGRVGVMGVKSLVESPLMAEFAAANAPDASAVSLINASAMVELVESGAFLFSPDETQDAVDGFVEAIFAEAPEIDVLTLSSTHLPWLRPFFERARPDCLFLDPAEQMVAALGEGVEGSGAILGLVTEDETYDLAGFRKMLERIGVDIPLDVVKPA